MRQIGCLLLAALVPSLAQAEPLKLAGLGVSLAYQSYDLGDTEGQEQIEGSFGGTFGPFLFQLDLSHADYEERSEKLDALGLHLGYQVTPDLAFAAFHVEENWGPDGDYRHSGIEAVYALPDLLVVPVTVEAFAGQYRNQSGTGNFEIDDLSIGATGDIGRGFSLGIGYLEATGSREYRIARFAAAYEVRGVELSLEAHKYLESSEETAVGIGLRYTFGRKPRFDGRSFVDLFPAEF